VTASAALVEFGPYRLDRERRLMWRGDELVEVPPKALDLLSVLVAEAGEVVTKEELLRRAWPDTAVSEANLSVNISILRRALGERETGESWINTVPRRGYRFTGEVREAPGPPRSLAVLPFRPLADDAGDEALGLGLADTLIAKLAATRRVSVRPTSAIRSLSSPDVDPLTAGRKLQVGAVLDGRYQRSGERLRITAQLLVVDRATAVWARTFDVEKGDLFAVEDEIAGRLADALVAELSPEEKERMARRPTGNLAAWQAYSRGRLFWGRFSRPWVEKAVLAFQEAAMLDPAYAEPHAGLADCFLVAGLSGGVAPPLAWTLAEGATGAARERDPDLAEVHVSTGFLRLFGAWDWTGAEGAFRRAIEVAPLAAAGHQWLGLLLTLAGRRGEADEALAAASEIDPLSVVVSALRGLSCSFSGDHEEELARSRRTLELDPGQLLGHWGVGSALHNLGRFAEAVDELRVAVDVGDAPAFLRLVLARSLAAAGQPREARLILDEVGSPGGASQPYLRATVHLALGEPEPALALLRGACGQKDPWVVAMPRDPALGALRGDPAFRAFVERVGPPKEA